MNLVRTRLLEPAIVVAACASGPGAQRIEIVLQENYGRHTIPIAGLRSSLRMPLPSSTRSACFEVQRSSRRSTGTPLRSRSSPAKALTQSA